MIDFVYIPGQTPLTEEEKRDLIPSLATREDLDAWEQQNIIEAREWLMKKSTLARKVAIREDFLLDLHKRMFGRVWRWAGNYRRSDKNIGAPFYEVPIQLRQLLDDANYWQEHDSFPVRDMAIMLHHRLVKIHLFANGNGRHSRLCADAIVAQAGVEPLSWGGGDLNKPEELRRRYISALQAADSGDYAPLLDFAS
jgi:Fic-DOC domain mobile mystery protein B